MPCSKTAQPVNDSVQLDPDIPLNSEANADEDSNKGSTFPVKCFVWTKLKK